MNRTTSKVLLTGATGFIGSQVLDGLLDSGLEVVILKRSGSSMTRISHLKGALTSYDVDKVPLETVFRQSPVEVVIHMATSYGRKGETLEDVVATNVLFGIRLLEAAAKFGVSTFINSNTFSIKGSELPDGLAYYVLSKRHFSEYGARLATSAGIAFVDMRLEHVYGPADDATKFVPSLVAALLSGCPSFDLTPGGQGRDFVYVSDVVAAYLRVLERRTDLPRSYSCIDVGSGEAVTLAEFVRLARDVAGSDTELRFGALPYRAGELMHSVADTGTLRRLGWAPTVGLREGLERAVAAARAAARTST